MMISYEELDEIETRAIADAPRSGDVIKLVTLLRRLLPLSDAAHRLSSARVRNLEAFRDFQQRESELRQAQEGLTEVLSLLRDDDFMEGEVLHPPHT